jgi:flagellar motor switch protein FliM
MTPSSNILEAPAETAIGEAGQAVGPAADAPEAALPNVAAAARLPVNVQIRDFRKAPLLSARDLQKLRVQQNDFVHALASRLSLFLRLEFTLKLAGLQTALYRKLPENWAGPTFLALFKAEPAAGVGVLEITPGLGSLMVDRLMGGPGVPSDPVREFSEIEKAILEQTAQLVIGEWCAHWRATKELKPVILGHETSGRFVQVASPETVMLVIALELRVAGNAGTMQIAFPYAALEPLIRQLSHGTNSALESGPLSPARPAPKWNAAFDDVRVPVAARWHWSELTARDMLALKIGDVLQVDPASAGGMEVCVADLPRFNARPGIVSGKWAAELGRPLKD